MAFIGGLLNFLIVLCSLFLICIVLIQRGRGGGLAGAFGGLGGSSAFGTKAGDVFTRVTVVTAIIWFILAMALVIVNNRGQTSAFDDVVGRGSAREVTPTDTGTPTGAPTAPAGAKTEGGTDAAKSAPAAATDDLGLPPALTEDAPATGAAAPGGDAAEDASTDATP